MKLAKDLRSAVDALIRKGWRLERGSKHPKLYPPSGRPVTLPGTPSEWRATANCLALLRRVERASRS